MEGLRQLVRFKTGMDVRIGFPIIGLTIEQEKVLESPQYAVAFGLLKKALKDSNALNEEMVSKPVRKTEKPKSKFGESVFQKLTLFFNEE